MFVHLCLEVPPSVHSGGHENASRLGRELAARADVVVVAASAWAAPARQLARAAGLCGAAVVWIAHAAGDHHGGPDEAEEELPIAGVLHRSELGDERQLQVGLRALLLGQNWPGAAAAARRVGGTRRRGSEGGAAGGGLQALQPNSVEVEVLSLLAAGHETAQIAAELFYSERTVKSYISRAVNRLGVRNRTQAVAAAVRRGLL